MKEQGPLNEPFFILREMGETRRMDNRRCRHEQKIIRATDSMEGDKKE
jgi:hypothetical protein